MILFLRTSITILFPMIFRGSRTVHLFFLLRCVRDGEREEGHECLRGCDVTVEKAVLSFVVSLVSRCDNTRNQDGTVIGTAVGITPTRIIIMSNAH